MRCSTWFRQSRLGVFLRNVGAGAHARARTFNVQRSTLNAQLIVLLFCHVGGLCADTVTWSDGRTREGKVELGDAALIRLHDGQRVRAWGVDEVAAISFSPATQEMERAWVFKEAGKTAKEFSGLPYPTLELQSAVALRTGETVHGHLLTTVFYLTVSNRTEKLVLKYKLRGQEGQSFSDVVYAASIRLGAVPQTMAGRSRVNVTLAGVTPQAELALVSRVRMQESEVRRSGTNSFQVLLDGGDIVPAVHMGGMIAVGWGGEATPAARGRIEQGLRDLKDFFDDRRLLGISQDPADETTCHTLLLLTRSAKTTMDGANTQPWRLEVWKWRLGSDVHDITAATRCVLFRGIRAPGAPLPEIKLDCGLHPLEHLSDSLTLQP